MKIAFLGDVALLGQFSVINGVESRIAYLQELLSEYDYVVANLESPLTNKMNSLVPKSMHLRANEECVEVLQLLGINAVSLANNHMFDFGRKGLDDTIRVLNHAGIRWFGLDGKSISDTIAGERISLSGFCCLTTNAMGFQKNGRGINLLTRKNLEKQLFSDRSNGEISLVSIHYGIEHTSFPSIEHIALFDQMAKENTSVFWGHHPHQIQGIKEINGSVIAYSLGNALFDKSTSLNGSFSLELNEDNRKSFVFGVKIKNEMISGIETKGFYISDEGIVPYNIEKELSDISFNVSEISDREVYQNKRINQYHQKINEKFGKHDIKWLISRLNYYSIGAKLISIIRTAQYRKVKKNVLVYVNLEDLLDGNNMTTTSVILATYNGEKYIVDQIDSIRTQTQLADEVIICDDCSQDDTIFIIKDYIKKYNLNNWHLITNSNNKGHIRNFLDGAELATGSILFFSDQDDIWKNEKIEHMCHVFDRRNTLAVCCLAETIDSEGNLIKRPINKYQVMKTNSTIYEVTLTEKLKYAISPGHALAFRKSVLQEIRKMALDYNLPHDIPVGTVAAVHGGYYMLNEVLVSRRIHQNNASNPNITLRDGIESVQKQYSSREMKRNELIAIQDLYSSYLSEQEKKTLSYAIDSTSEIMTCLENKKTKGIVKAIMSNNPMMNRLLAVRNLLAVLYNYIN